MKRQLSLFLALAFTLASLVSCTPKADSSVDPDSSADTSSTTEKSPDTKYNGELPLSKDKVTLTFATHQGTNSSIAPPSNDLPLYQKLEELTNVHIEWETIPYDTYGQIMQTRIASGDKLADIINLTALGNYEILATDNVIIAQNDLLDKYGYWTNKFFEENPSYRNLMTSPDGNIYSIENTIIDNFATGIMVNKYSLEKIGLKEMPASIDDFYKMLIAFRDTDLNGNGKKDEIPLVLPFGVSGNYEYMNVLGNAFGLEMTWQPYVAVKDNKVVSNYELPEYREFLEFIKKLYSENLINKDLTSITYDKMIEYVTNGQCGAVGYWTTYAYLFGAASPDVKAVAEKGQEEQVPVFVPMDPLATKDNDRYFTRRVGLNGDGMGISVDCSKELLPVAMKWIDFLFGSPQSLEMQSFGVEGTTYKKNTDGTIEKIIPADGSDWGSAVTAIGGNQPPRAHQQSIESYRNSWLPKWLDDVVAHQDQFYRAPKALPIKWTVEEEETYTKYMPDLDVYLQENIIAFITGTKDMKEYDAFVTGLDAMGMSEYKKIFEARYARQMEQ